MRNTFAVYLLVSLFVSTSSWQSDCRKCISGYSRSFYDLKELENSDDQFMPLTSGAKTKSSTDILTPRRHVLRNVFGSFSLLQVVNSNPSVTWADVPRAVGGAEQECRAAGNCWETGQLDGVVGWNWGGKDRCDASDPRCGPDGKLLDDLPKGKPVPEVTNKITHLAGIYLDIGREETGLIRLGFYGEDCPGSVSQMLRFLTSSGLVTIDSQSFENSMGVVSVPLSLTRGGIVPDIVPGQIIDFGVPSQRAAYARSRGVSKLKDDFAPQPRPSPTETETDQFTRMHDVAGLVSIPKKGLGYTGFEPDDEAFGSAFQITADAVPSLDKAGRRVIGQVVDSESMAFLARLASLPTKKGLKGVIPGLNSGPPLLRVTIREIKVVKAE